MALLWGAGFGVSAVAFVLSIRPPLPTLAEASRRISAQAEESTAAPRPTDLITRTTTPVIRLLERIGLPSERLRADLSLLGVAPDAFLLKQVYAAIAGVVLPVPAFAAMLAFGVAVPFEACFVASGVLGLVLFFTPDAEVKRRAEDGRAEAREALDVLLGFTATSMAAGDGIEAALEGASAIGVGQAFDRFREAGAAARTSRRPVWTTYGEAADDLGLSELRELAASISLAGGEGAKIADSLTAKAGSLRGRRNAERQAQNASTTEKMHLPLGVDMIGFLMIIAFPSLYKVLTGF